MKEKEIKKLFEGKRIAVTGGLGSIGSQIVNKILSYYPEKIILIDNRETELFHADNVYKNGVVETIFCDVRERDRVRHVLKGVDIVFHAAAMKHVIICEKNPFEAVKTNVIGTQNIIESCLSNKVKKMIFISTDKAVNPTNVMGATKLLAERLVSSMCNVREEGDTEFGIVRFGNVLYSRGSVLEIWEKQLEKGKKITVTDPNMTRFFMSVPQSIDLILMASSYAKNGETFILKMPSVKIGTLAEVFLEMKGYPPDHFDVIGARPGEKMHEELVFEEEAKLLLENKDFLLRLPLQMENKDYSFYMRLGFKKSKQSIFRSNDPKNLLDKESIKRVLHDYVRNRPKEQTLI